MRHFLSIQQFIDEGELENVYWIPGVEYPADGLTKLRSEMGRFQKQDAFSQVSCVLLRAWRRGNKYALSPPLLAFFFSPPTFPFCICIYKMCAVFWAMPVALLWVGGLVITPSFLTCSSNLCFFEWKIGAHAVFPLGL